MNATDFYREWMTSYSRLTMTAASMASAFDITSAVATSILQSLLKDGKVTARHYTKSRKTVYTLSTPA